MVCVVDVLLHDRIGNENYYSSNQNEVRRELEFL